MPGAGSNGVVNAGGLSFEAFDFETIIKGVTVGDRFLPFDKVLIGNYQNNTLDVATEAGGATTDAWLVLGRGGSDTITGSQGNDILVGGAANDTLNGGDGDDTFLVGLGDGDDMFNGDGGNDVVLATADNVEIGLRNNYTGSVEEFSANGFSGVEIHGNYQNNVLDFSGTDLTGIHVIDGEGGNDTITGTDQAETIIGGAHNDTLNGGDGDDTFLVGLGDGDDMFNGDGGNDVVLATADNVEIGLRNNYTGSVEEFSANGFSGVEIHGNYQNNVLDFSGTNLTDIHVIDGEGGNDTITGTDQAETIIGGAHNDTLNGGDGDDTFLVGLGDGDDMFNGDGGNDVVLATADNVEIGLRNNYTGSVEEFSANGFSGVEIHGNWQNNVLDFSGTDLTGIHVIDGEGGNDTITGTDQAETIIGGAGNDKLNAGGGDDTAIWNVGDGADQIDGGSGDESVGDTLIVNSTAAGQTITLTAPGDGGNGFTVQEAGSTDIVDVDNVEEVVVDFTAGSGTLNAVGDFTASGINVLDHHG